MAFINITASFGQTDAARRAAEQHDAEPRLKHAKRLADRRTRDPSPLRAGAKAVSFCDHQECGKAGQIHRHELGELTGLVSTEQIVLPVWAFHLRRRVWRPQWRM